MVVTCSISFSYLFTFAHFRSLGIMAIELTNGELPYSDFLPMRVLILFPKARLHNCWALTGAERFATFWKPVWTKNPKMLFNNCCIIIGHYVIMFFIKYECSYRVSTYIPSVKSRFMVQNRELGWIFLPYDRTLILVLLHS